MTNNDLINKIKRLEAHEPSESWLRSNREFIFKYIDLDDKKESVAQTGFAFGVSAIRSRISFALSIFSNRMLTGAVSLAAVFILVGSFAAGEAEGSLPGDRLYAVKTFMEKAQLAFAFNDEKRVALNFELTEKRLDEFSAVASQKDENSSEVKTAADNLKNQLKVAAQELNSAKTNSSAETAVSVAKIADTKTTAYAKKLNEVKKELSSNKNEQLNEVATNIEELNNSALAVLATNSKIGDLNTEEIAAKLKEKIVLAEVKIDETQKKVSLYEAEIKKSNLENKEAVESLALSVKLITEARAVLGEAQLSFKAGNFSKTWDLLVKAGNIAIVAEDVGNRVAVVPAISPLPLVSPEPGSTVSSSPAPSVSPSPSASPVPSVTPKPSVAPSPKPSVAPVPAL
ncbi:MAG: DUF5667 domain-containing protein [bacterium]|nr:DUF5667 domain-containing protein [bacterium]